MVSRRKLPAPVAMRNTSGAVGALLGREVEAEELAVSNQRAPLAKIHRLRFKRLYYDPDAIVKFGDQLRQEGGVHTPVWVRPLADGPEGEFELIAGNFRWLGSELAGFDDLPILVFDVDDRTALKLSRIENDQRSDFNKADELYLFLEELSLDLVLPKDEVVKLLYRLDNELRGKSTQRSVGSDTIAVIEAFFETTRVSRSSFVAKWLPILKWPLDVLQALGQLSYDKLVVIRGVKDPEQRQALIEEAISESLPISTLKERVQALNEGVKPKPKEPTLKDTMSGVLRQLKTVKLEAVDPKDQKALGKSLNHMADILAKYS